MSAQTILKGFNSCHKDNGHGSLKPRLPNFLADKTSPQLQLLAIILIGKYIYPHPKQNGSLRCNKHMHSNIVPCFMQQTGAELIAGRPADRLEIMIGKEQKQR